MNDIYSEAFQKSLFNEMAKTYGIMNTLCSFGFNYLWRKACVENAHIQDADTVCDIMSGNGENGFLIKRNIAHLTCIDYSSVMAKKCIANSSKFNFNTDVIIENIFNVKLQKGSFDKIVCSFGMKTLKREDREKIIDVMIDSLKDKGIISIMEFEIPKNIIIKPLWSVYVQYIIPLLGKSFMGNSNNYRMLYQYALNYESDGKLDFIFNDKRIFIKTYHLHFGSAMNYVIQKR